MTGYSHEEETNSPISSIKSNTSVTSIGKYKIMINTLWVEAHGAVCSAFYHPFINECHSVLDPQHCSMLDSTCEYLNNSECSTVCEGSVHHGIH